MDIEYDIMLEGYELFHDEEYCESDLIPWKPDPNEVYPIVLPE